MASLGKKLGQFKQWTGRKREGEEAALETLASSMISFGSILPPDSAYGKSLIRFGETHHKVVNAHLEFTNAVRDGYFGEMDRTLADMKEYNRLKTKLENRRLDFDAKLNKIQKSKKENAVMEEETRMAQSKYEETLADLTTRMVSLNSNEEEQLQELLNYLDAEVNCVQQTLDLLTGLKREFASIPRAHTSHRANVQRTQSSTSSIYRNSMSDEVNVSDRKLSSAAHSGSMVFPVQPSTPPPPLPSRDPLPAQKQVRVLYDFDAENPGELTIRPGDIINVIEEIDEG
ncbi:hypothetical protein HDU76_008270, partial [Blyttiomyces sp. JEL0837]